MRLSCVVNIAAAFFLAAATSAVVVGLLSTSLRIVPTAFLIALAHACILGLPLFVFLWRTRQINVWTSVLSGFAIGAMPISLVVGLSNSSDFDAWIGAGSERVQTVADGVPTLAGWIGYVETVATLGVFGALGGLMFYLLLRATQTLPGPANGIRTPLGTALIPMAALIIATLILSVPTAIEDRSCHNVLRDGRQAISPVLNMDLAIPDGEWPELAEVLASFAVENGMSYRNDSEVYPDTVTTLYLNVCTDFLTISTAEQKWASRNNAAFSTGRGVGIMVYETEEGSRWQQVARRLIERLEERWPGQVRYRDGGGSLVPPPESISTSVEH